MAQSNPALNVARLSKRYFEFSKQIAADIRWHRDQCRSDCRLFWRRLVEQTRLLQSSAICAEDYYNLGLHRETLSAEQKSSFLGSYQKWRYWNQINPPVYDVLARDKALFHIFAESLGIPTPETIGTTAPDNKPFFGRSLDNVEATKAFLYAHEGQDLFFKPVDGSLGEGALAVGAACPGAGKWCQLPARTPISVEEVLQHLLSEGALGRFLIQRRLKPHEAMAKVVPDVCPTLRIMTLMTGAGVEFLGMALRIGSGRSATDNVAGGGLVAPVDLECGLLHHAICLDSGTPELVSAHPLTGASLSQLQIPEWPAIKALVTESAAKLNFLPCIGWDIGLADKGPVVIEINTRPRCISVQSGATSGLLSGPLGRELAKTAGRLNNGLTVRSFPPAVKPVQLA